MAEEQRSKGTEEEEPAEPVSILSFMSTRRGKGVTEKEEVSARPRGPLSYLGGPGTLNLLGRCDNGWKKNRSE